MRLGCNYSFLLNLNGGVMKPFSHGWVITSHITLWEHDDVIKWKRFPRYWPFVRGIHRSPVNSPHNGQRRGNSVFSLICVWIGWVNNREAGDLRRHRAHYHVTVMKRLLLHVLFSDLAGGSDLGSLHHVIPYGKMCNTSYIIKTHVRGFFDTDLHEVSWHFATHEAVRPSGF